MSVRVGKLSERLDQFWLLQHIAEQVIAYLTPALGAGCEVIELHTPAEIWSASRLPHVWRSVQLMAHEYDTLPLVLEKLHTDLMETRVRHFFKQPILPNHVAVNATGGGVNLTVRLHCPNAINGVPRGDGTDIVSIEYAGW